MQTLPFHPQGGMAWGGVAIVKNEIVVLDPTTEQVAAWTGLPEGISSLKAVYENNLLFSLFPDTTWYIGRPWVGHLKLTLLDLDRSRHIEGLATFRRPAAPEQMKPWDAEVAYKSEGPTWDVHLSLPADHPYPVDIVFRTRLVGTVYDTLGGVVPAEGRTGHTYRVGINNLFDSAGVFGQTPYVCYGIGRRPHLYLMNAYSWAWN